MGFREYGHDSNLEKVDLKSFVCVPELWPELLDLRAKAEASGERWKTFGGRSDMPH
jgi:hypothetical protein